MISIYTQWIKFKSVKTDIQYCSIYLQKQRHSLNSWQIQCLKILFFPFRINESILPPLVKLYLWNLPSHVLLTAELRINQARRERPSSVEVLDWCEPDGKSLFLKAGAHTPTCTQTQIYVNIESHQSWVMSWKCPHRLHPNQPAGSCLTVVFVCEETPAQGILNESIYKYTTAVRGNNSNSKAWT